MLEATYRAKEGKEMVVDVSVPVAKVFLEKTVPSFGDLLS